MTFDTSLAATYVCTKHRIPIKVREASLNRGVARLGSDSDPAVRKAIIHAIWPEVDSSCCDDVACIRESGHDADWILECPTCGRVLALAEHKPFKAPAHWSVAEIGAYHGLGVLETPEWANGFPGECKGAHAPHREGHPHPAVLIRKSQPPRVSLGAPQVLVYSHRHGDQPVTIVQYGQTPASELYDTQGLGGVLGFSLDERLFPTRTTDDVLNSLSRSLNQIDLNSETKAFARNLIGALWYRSGASKVDNPLLEHARGWIPVEYSDCFGAPSHARTRWSDRLTGSQETANS